MTGAELANAGMASTELTWGGGVFMLVSWGAILFLLVFCFTRILGNGKGGKKAEPGTDTPIPKNGGNDTPDA